MIRTSTYERYSLARIFWIHQNTNGKRYTQDSSSKGCFLLFFDVSSKPITPYDPNLYFISIPFHTIILPFIKTSLFESKIISGHQIMSSRVAVRSLSVASKYNASLQKGVRQMSANAKVWVDKDTKVICQGFTGKQVSFIIKFYADVIVLAKVLYGLNVMIL